MRELTIGKLRGLQQCASPVGVFTCLALDHRQNLRRALNPANPGAVSDADLIRFKLEVTASLCDGATAVLLDPEYGAAQAIAAGVLPGQVGLVVALEATGFSGAPTARYSQVLSGWSPAQARRIGASMVKLLVYYHPGSSSAPEVESFVQQVAQACAEEDLGLMLEPLSYPIDPAQKSLPSAEKRDVVVETAHRLTQLGVEVLKAEFPLDPVNDPDEDHWAIACAEITAASAAPWILLSAAVDYETYFRQVRVACQAGAAGVAVGRAVWKEALEMDAASRQDFLQSVARQRLQRLNALCTALAHPWMAYYTAPKLMPDWYLRD